MKLLNVRSLGVIVSAVLMMAAIGGCSNDAPAAINPGLSTSNSGGGSGSELTTGEGLPDIQSEWIFDPDTGLQVVYFD